MDHGTTVEERVRGSAAPHLQDHDSVPVEAAVVHASVLSLLPVASRQWLGVAAFLAARMLIGCCSSLLGSEDPLGVIMGDLKASLDRVPPHRSLGA